MGKIFCILGLLIFAYACMQPRSAVKNADLTPIEIVHQFPEGPLRAGVASIDVTPSNSQYLAGFGNNRKSRGVHDPIYVRAVIFEKAGKRIALVSIDVIGIQRGDLPQYLEKIKDVPLENVIITCTHNHSGPDTIGLWGRIYALSDGRDLKWIEFLSEKVGEAVKLAVERMERVELVFGRAQVPEKGVVRNIREQDLVDRELSVIGIYPISGKKPRGILVNFAMHAEALWDDNKLITADWPGYMRSYLEEMTGAETAIFFNGALGAMVTVDNRLGDNGEELHTFEESERVGIEVARTAVLALNSGERISEPEMIFVRRVFYMPSDNQLYNFFSYTPRITREFYNGYLQTEVNYIRIGELEILTFPGEAYPKIGISVKQRMTGKYRWIIGLANDELGYLLYPDDHYKKLYSYEAFTSMSRLWGGLLVEKQAVELSERYGIKSGK